MSWCWEIGGDLGLWAPFSLRLQSWHTYLGVCVIVCEGDLALLSCLGFVLVDVS